MADTQSSQPVHDPIFDRLEHSLEQWREHLTRLGPTLSPGEMTKLSRQWDSLRQNFDVASLQQGLEIHGLEGFMEALPILRDLTQDELEITLEALQTAKKTLKTMLSETDARLSLLEESLGTDKPQKIRKSLEKLRGIDEALQTRLLGLDAYIEQFRLAEIEEHDLLATTTKVIGQTARIQEWSEANAALEEQSNQMKRWLADSKLSLSRMQASPPPSPSAIQQASLSLGNASEVDKALMALYSNHQSLKDARLYLENFLAEKEGEE